MTILEHISQMKLGVLDGAFDGWTDERTVGRGYGYVDKVIELAAAGNLLAGVVKGATRYYTNVRLEKNGDLEAICSCPVGKRCKHSVALILRAKRLLDAQARVPSTIPENWTTRPLECAREVECRREEKRRQQRLEEEQRVECERKREEAFWLDFSAVREDVLVSCRNGSAEKIKAAVETFLEWADDDELYQHPQLSQKVWGAVDPTMAVVLETFEANGVDPADTIIWAYDLTAPDRGLSIGDRLEALRNSPAGRYAQPMVWEEAAHRIWKKLDEIPETGYSVGNCLSRPWYWVGALCAAWERAGDEEKAIDCYLKFASRIGNWQEVAQYLNKHQRYDKAIEIAREGIKASQMSGEYDNDDYVEMQEQLADAFSGKGDYLMAMAVRAEAFLVRIGAYEEKRSVAQFNRILSEAEKAGIRGQVRRALIHALETGVNPSSIATFKFNPAKQESGGSRVPTPAVCRIKTTAVDTPPWPLPWANEGVRLFDSRWRDCEWFCQQDMEFLLKLAIVGGDKAEMARRFDDLPETPHNGGMPLEGAKAEMCELLMAAMKGYRDDIVLRLSELRKCCYVREVRDGVKCAVRVIKRLGESSADVFPDWPTAIGSWG